VWYSYLGWVVSPLEMNHSAERAEDDAGGAGDSVTTYCAAHPRVETRLRCGKCERPICPKCLVFTPVGARCRACANLKPLPVFQVGPRHYAEALGAALAVGLVGGLLWAFIAVAIPFLAFWLVLGIGYLAGVSISIAANRKRGRGLQVIAGATVLLAYLAQGIILALVRFPGLMGSGLLVVELALRQFGALFANPLFLLAFAAGVYIAVRRV